MPYASSVLHPVLSYVVTWQYACVVKYMRIVSVNGDDVSVGHLIWPLVIFFNKRFPTSPDCLYIILKWQRTIPVFIY